MVKVYPSVPLAILMLAVAHGQESDIAAKIYAQSANSVLLILLRSTDGQPVAQGTGFLVENGREISQMNMLFEVAHL